MKPGDAAERPWINPIGGYGDMLLLSSVLKQVADSDPNRKFNLLRRTGYGTFLRGHPAIAEIGFPPKDATIQHVTYWSLEDLGPGDQRPMQVLARSFGLETPIEETLWIPGEPPELDPIVAELLPDDRPIVALSPSSESPRKTLEALIWHQVVEMLLADDVFVVQLGTRKDQHVRNTYSLRGLTTPHQAIALLGKCNLVLGSDNFVMHAAHYTKTPGVIVWGPTHHEVYGWPEHTHLQMKKACGLSEFDDCIGPKRNEGGRLYVTKCPHGDKHCVDQVDPRAVYAAARKLLKY